MTDHQDQIAIQIVPRPEQVSDTDADFLAAIIKLERPGPGTFEEVFQGYWPKNSPKIFLPVLRSEKIPERYSHEHLQLAPTEENEDITHLVLVEGPNPHHGLVPFFFYNQEVKAISIMLYFSETKQKYIPIHCQDCAQGIVEYVMDCQKAWSNVESAKIIPINRSLN